MYRRIDSFRICDIEAIITAGQLIANWAAHGCTCKGWQNAYVKNRDDVPITYDNIPVDERPQYYCLFEPKDCSCGVTAISKIVYEGATVALRKKLHASMTTLKADTTNESILKVEIQDLKWELEKMSEMLEDEKQKSLKLERKLAQIQAAASKIIG